MNRKITEHEMDRRREMCLARMGILTAMESHELTVMEWVNVLNQIQQRLIVIGLKEDWEER